jgi:hypothetical protein
MFALLLDEKEKVVKDPNQANKKIRTLTVLDVTISYIY